MKVPSDAPEARLGTAMRRIVLMDARRNGNDSSTAPGTDSSRRGNADGDAPSVGSGQDISCSTTWTHLPKPAILQECMGNRCVLS